MTITTTQTTTTEIRLKPLLKRQLLLKLRSFEVLKQQVEVAKAGQDRLKGEIEQLFDRAGELTALRSGMKVEGFSVRKKGGVTKQLNKKRLCEITGISPAQIAEATKEVPKKEYVEIRCPGEKDEEGEE